jgi:hypothetical protein
MPLTRLQRDVCRLLGEERKNRGESYVAGGVALNELLHGTRRSHDIDLFHDSLEALRASWDADRALLLQQGFSVEVVRERPAFVEAVVRRAHEETLVEWAQDSAFRFFPLIAHAELGVTLHPFDLATNKTLALVGRREPRDWIDILHCDETLQPFGYLVWASAGKDPGYGPGAIIEEAARSARYAQEELDALDFTGVPPDAGTLARRWKIILAEAHAVIDALPAAHAGTCVLTDADGLLRAPPEALSEQLARGAVRFHHGRIGGAFPNVTNWPR